MRNVKYTLGSFSAGDFKAVEHYLNAQAAAGWDLVRPGPLLNKWRRTERTDLRWCVDLASPRQEREARLDYLQLCSEAGWELAAFSGGMYFFRSRPGADAIPVQTDPELERKNYDRYYIKECILSALIILAYAAFYALMCFGLGGNWGNLAQALRTQWYESWLVAALLLTAPVWGVLALLKLANFVSGLWRGRGGIIPTPPQAVMRLNCLCGALSFLGAAVIALAAALEHFFSGSSKINVTLLVLIGCWACACLYYGFLREEDLFPGERKNFRQAGFVLLGVLALLIIGRSVSPCGSWSDYRADSEGLARYEALADAPVIKLEELGFDRSERNSRRVTERIAPTGRTWLVEDYDGLWPLGCQSTLCFTEGQAEWLCAQRRDAIAQSAGGSDRYPMPGVALSPLALDWADEAWYGEYHAEDAQFSLLLLRRGRLVCRVIAPEPLTAEELAAVQRELAD